MNNELWRGIEGYPNYEVSSLGRVRSWAKAEKSGTPVILKPVHRNTGSTHYLNIGIYNENGRKTALIHQLVTEAFKGKRPEGMVCRHINGDSLDNRAENLEWGTPAQNTADRYEHGTANFIDGKVPPVLTDDEVIDVFIRTQQGETVSQIAVDYPHVSRETIRLIVVGKARVKVINAFLEGQNVTEAVAS